MCEFIYHINPTGRIFSQQILRAGTSVGANIEEAYAGQSKRDFINKISIALNEAPETHYWLRLLKDTKTVPAERLNDIIKDSEELKKILAPSIITAKCKLNK